MVEGDRHRFAQVMFVLGGAFRTQLAEATLESYWKGLRGFDVGTVEKAADRAVDNLDRLPVVAQMRRYAFEIAREMRATHSIEGPKCDWAAIDRSWQGGWAQDFPGQPWPGLKEAQRRLRDAVMGGMLGCYKRPADTRSVRSVAIPKPDRRLPREPGDDDLDGLPF